MNSTSLLRQSVQNEIAMSKIHITSISINYLKRREPIALVALSDAIVAQRARNQFYIVLEHPIRDVLQQHHLVTFQ